MQPFNSVKSLLSDDTLVHVWCIYIGKIPVHVYILNNLNVSIFIAVHYKFSLFKSLD